MGDQENSGNTNNGNANQPYVTELRLAEPEPFFGLNTEDPEAWLRRFHQRSRVNRWADWNRKRDYLAFYLRDEASYWFRTLEDGNQIAMYILQAMRRRCDSR